MTPTFTTRILVVVIAASSLVGMADAVVDKTWDHVVLFGVGGVVSALLLVRTLSGRQVVRLRADQVHWLARRSQLTGEPIDHIAARGLATYRSLLDDSMPPDTPPRRSRARSSSAPEPTSAPGPPKGE